METQRLRKDGREIFVSVGLIPIKDIDGAVVGIAAINRDITERKQLEREVVEIASMAQRRIGQDLHDSVGQELTALKMLAADLVESEKEPSQSQTARRIAEGLQRTMDEVRDVIRGLMPVAVDEQGLMAALTDLAARTSQKLNIRCTFNCPEPVVIEDNITATHLYLIAQEAVTNAVKHGRPKHIEMRLQKDGHTITLNIQDDGEGIGSRPQDGSGLGLRIMRNRAAIIGATLEVGPRKPAGTFVRCTLHIKNHD
jgi:signal transduction histidine kinase